MARKDLGALVQSLGAPQETPVPEKTDNPQPEPPAAKPTKTAPRVEETPEPAAKQPARTGPRKPAEAPDETLTGEEPGTSTEPANAGIQVMLPQELNDRLQAYLAQKGVPHATVLMLAIEKTYKRLPQLVAEARGLELEEEDDDDRVVLFERPARERQPAGAPRAKHHVRLTPKNRKILDTVAKQVGAPSRNFMITTAYNAFLPQLPTTES